MATYYHTPGATARSALPQWAATTAYAQGAKVRSTTATNKYWLECTTAGTSGGSQPTWNTAYGGTTNDGTAVWTTRGTGDLGSTFPYPDNRAFSIKDTFNSSTYNQLFDYDKCYLAEGTYTNDAGVSHRLQSAAAFYGPFNQTTGVASFGRGVIDLDGANNVSTVMLSTSTASYVLLGFKFRRGTQYGLEITGTTASMPLFLGCEMSNNGGSGVFCNVSSSAGFIFAYCKAENNTSNGFYFGNMARQVAFYRCAARGNAAKEFYCNRPVYIDCIGSLSVTSGVARAIFGGSAVNNDGLAIDCTANSEITSVNNANANSAYNLINNVFRCLAANMQNAGAGSAFGILTVNNLYGNVLYNNKGTVSGITGLDLDAGSYLTTNPGFASAANLTPTASNWTTIEPDLNSIWTETAWNGPGAIPKAASGGGGGAGGGCFGFPL